VKRKIHRYL